MAPSLNIIDHDYYIVIWRVISCPHREVSQTHSHHFVWSLATNRLRHSTNSKSSDPTTLSFYWGMNACNILSLTKDYFVVRTFSADLFFYHRRSLHLETFKSKANDVLALAAWEQLSRCFYLNPYTTALILLYSGSLVADDYAFTMVCWHSLYLSVLSQRLACSFTTASYWLEVPSRKMHEPLSHVSTTLTARAHLQQKA